MRPGIATLVLVAACSTGATPATEWAENSPMGVARSEHPAVVWQGEIVVIGGLVESGFTAFEATRSVEAYDPGSDGWRSLPDLPEPLHHAMAAVVSDRIFVLGGFSGPGFDPGAGVWELVDGSWVERAALPAPVGAGAAVTLDGHVYVVGGSPGAGLHRYDPGGDTWAALRSPGVPREHVAAVTMDGEIWALGGRWQGEVYDSTEIYDPASDTWRDGPRLNEARSGFGAATVGESIVAAGGELLDPLEALSSVEMLDPATGVWSIVAPLPTGLHGNPLVTIGTTIYLPGGSSRAGGVENAGEMLSLIVD